MSDTEYTTDDLLGDLAQTSSWRFPRKQIPEKFEAWLKRMRADAWDEGAQSAYYDPETRDRVSYPDNPYREVTK